MGCSENLSIEPGNKIPSLGDDEVAGNSTAYCLLELDLNFPPCPVVATSGDQMGNGKY